MQNQHYYAIFEGQSYPNVTGPKDKIVLMKSFETWGRNFAIALNSAVYDTSHPGFVMSEIMKYLTSARLGIALNGEARAVQRNKMQPLFLHQFYLYGLINSEFAVTDVSILSRPMLF